MTFYEIIIHLTSGENSTSFLDVRAFGCSQAYIDINGMFFKLFLPHTALWKTTTAA